MQDKTAKSTALSRNYSPRTLKILFTFCGNQCAHPDCTQPIIENATAFSGDLVVGQISHIYAHSDKGPRGKPGMTEQERREADNLLLFCPTHHVIVDGQHETYPAYLLFEWKRRHERPYRDSLTAKLNDLGYAELEVAARALVAAATDATGGYIVIPPADKIAKNKLGSTSTMLLTLGAAKSKEVSEVLRNAAQLESAFPERLRSGFQARYGALVAEGLTGDDLFMAMYEWAGGGNINKAREVAGVSVDALFEQHGVVVNPPLFVKGGRRCRGSFKP
jgi:hypothetical protein